MRGTASSTARTSVYKTCFFRIQRAGLCFTALGLLLVFVAGCSSSSAVSGSNASTGGSGTTTTPPAGDFSIVVSPSSLTLGDGASQTVSVGVTQINTYTASVSLAVSGLPAGVSVSPATFSLTPGSQQVVTLTAAASVTPVSAIVTFQATSGSLSHSAQAALS